MEEKINLILAEIQTIKSDIVEMKADIKSIKKEVNGLSGFTSNADILKNIDFLTAQHAANHQ